MNNIEMFTCIHVRERVSAPLKIGGKRIMFCKFNLSLTFHVHFNFALMHLILCKANLYPLQCYLSILNSSQILNTFNTFTRIHVYVIIMQI